MSDEAVAQPQGQSGSRKNDLKTRILGYSGLFLLAYFVFLIFTFPYDLLFRGLLGHFQGQIPAAMQPLVFDDVSPDFPLGAGFKGLAVGKTPSGAPLFEADSLDISAGMFKAIFGKIDASWKADLYGGKMRGSYNGNTSDGKIELKMSAIQVERLAIFKSLTKMDMTGKLAGTVNMTWNKVWQNNKGVMSFNIENASARSVNLKIVTADFVFTKVEGECSLENGVLTVKRFVLEGAPSGFEIEGNITISPQAPDQSALDLSIIFSPSPEFEKSIPFSILQKAGEGKYKAHLGGTFSSPIFP